jgi:hypothetical protein
VPVFDGFSMKYTKHGKFRSSERGISEDMILKAILEPDSIFYDLSRSATVVFRKLNEKHLLVVYSKEENEIKVITTFITSVARELIEKKLKSNVWVMVK